MCSTDLGDDEREVYNKCTVQEVYNKCTIQEVYNNAKRCCVQFSGKTPIKAEYVNQFR